MINAIRMLTIDEGFRDTAYKDTVGKITVGIGFNMDNPTARQIWANAGVKSNFDLVYNRTVTISKDDAWALLNICIANCEQDLADIFHDYATYPENIKLALLNLMYSLGAPKFKTFLTFIGRIRIENYRGAAEDLMTTLWAKQLPLRAKRVVALLENNDNPYAMVKD